MLWKIIKCLLAIILLYVIITYIKGSGLMVYIKQGWDWLMQNEIVVELKDTVKDAFVSAGNAVSGN